MSKKALPLIIAGIGVYMLISKSSPASVNNDQWYAIISKYSRIYGIPKSVIYAIIRIESSGHPITIEHSGYWSGIGAMQISLPTAQTLGFRGTKTQLLEADNNIHYGTAYLAHLKNILGNDIFKIVMGYHVGPDLRPWDAAYLSKFLKYYYLYAARLNEKALRYI